MIELTADAVTLGSSALSSSISVVTGSGVSAAQGGPIQIITTHDNELEGGYIFAVTETRTGSGAENDDRIMMLTDNCADEQVVWAEGLQLGAVGQESESGPFPC